jgi:UV DNA damage repair endonuclease
MLSGGSSGHLCASLVLCGVHHEDTKATKDSLSNEQASHSASEEMDVEVDEEAYMVSGTLEVGEKLRAVNRSEVFNGFDLDHHRILDQQVESDSDHQPSFLRVLRVLRVLGVLGVLGVVQP